MKKIFLLLASAALLFAGCTKENVVENVSKNAGEGVENVTFTVGVAPAATKAVADNDGQAANVNHWIMQVLDSDDAVYNYQEEDGTGLTHTFNVPLIKGQTYKVMFWADTKGNYVTVGKDKITDLREVKRASAVALVADRDDLDAFSAVVTNFTTTQATQQQITLYRPFAQLNVVFTDLDKLFDAMGSTQEYLKFKPVNFVAKAKVPTTFNVLTQTAGAPATTALEMGATECYNPSGEGGKDNYTTHKEKATLYMDYFFASKDTKDIVDIDFSFVSKGVTIAHEFQAIPFQRNYRTNIVGELMSAEATWNVIIDPEWDGVYLRGEQATATSIDEINDVLAQGASDVIVTAIAADDPDDTIYLPKSNEGVNGITITFPATSKAIKIAYKEGDEIYFPNLTVKAESMGNIEVNLPNSHVELFSGEFEAVEAATSLNSIVICSDAEVETLTVTEGAVKIYGEVTNVSVAPAEGKQVLFYDCYGLSGTVKAAVENYIANGYIFEENGNLWNIVPEVIGGDEPGGDEPGEQAQSKLPVTIDWTTASGCTVTGTSATISTTAEHVVIPEGATTMNSEEALDRNSTIKSLALPKSIPTFQPGFMGGCQNLTDLYIEGGGTITLPLPSEYPSIWGGGLQNIYIEKLPDSAPMQGDTIYALILAFSGNDPYRITSTSVNIYLPAGWKAKGYQYKFYCQHNTFGDAPTPVKVYEYNPESSKEDKYELLGTGTHTTNGVGVWNEAN